MVYGIVSWIVLALVVAWGGTQKGKPLWFGLVWSLLLSPLVGLFIVLLVRSENAVPQESTPEGRFDRVRTELYNRGVATHTPEVSKQMKEWYQLANTRDKSVKQLADEFEDFHRRWS